MNELVKLTGDYVYTYEDLRCLRGQQYFISLSSLHLYKTIGEFYKWKIHY